MNKEKSLSFKISEHNPELAIISRAIASSDNLVRKIDSLVKENRKLKQKYRSLSQSAVRVKQLYEEERDMCLKTLSKNTELKNKITVLIDQNLELEHSRINMHFTHSQAIAELEMKNHQEIKNTNTVLKELVFLCKDWTDVDHKYKGALRQAIDFLDKRGVEVNTIKIDKQKSRVKDRQKKGVDLMNIPSETCKTIFEEGEPDRLVYTRESFTKVKRPNKAEIGIQVEPTPKKFFISAATNTEIKLYFDKSTTYTSSTTTRAVSTECFIKKVDVGTVFPDLTALSIANIFEEMIIETPRLLSPVPESTTKISQSTQTMSITSETKESCAIALVSNGIKTRTRSTNTKLKNVRKPFGDCFKPQIVTYNVKKEECANHVNTLNLTLEQDINPQLTQLWIILGKLLFQLIGNGEIFNSNATVSVGKNWQQIQKLIEARSCPQQELRKEIHYVSKDNRTESNSTVKNSFETEDNSHVSSEVDFQSIVSEISEQVKADASVVNELRKISLETLLQIEPNVRPVPIKQMGSPCASTTSFKVSPLETTPRPFKRKLLDETTSPVSVPSEAITEHCIQILNSAKRRRENMLELLSPIKDLPKESETKSLITLSDFFGESDEEPVVANTKKPNACFQYILNKASPRSPPDWCKSFDKTIDSQNIPLKTAPNGEMMENCVESPVSPIMSCSLEDQNFDPVLIPINRPKSQIKDRDQPVIRTFLKTSALRVIINEYNYEKRLKVVKNTIQKTKDSHQISYDIEILRRLINEYLKEHWSRDAAQLIFQKCMKFKVDVVITAILETIEDNSDDPVSMENTPPAPGLPLTHQKLIMVVEFLHSCMKKKLLHALDRKIFTLKTGKHSENIQTLMSLAYFYIGLTDIETLEQNVSAARLFIYKSLYYYNHKSFPLVYAMMTAQPNCLSKPTNSAYKDDDALLTTFKTILMNCPKDTLERNEFKKRELRSLLLTEYSYRPFDPTTDAVVNILIERLKQNQLKNLDYSFILLAKRYGFEWAMSKVIKVHLYPLLEQLIAQSIESDTHDLQIVYCLRILSTILKTCPSNVDKTYFLQLFKTILDKSPKPMIQEAAVEALLRFQRFGFVDVYQRIKKWNPQHKITSKLLMMLKTFVYRKDLTFWNALE